MPDSQATPSAQPTLTQTWDKVAPAAISILTLTLLLAFLLMFRAALVLMAGWPLVPQAQVTEYLVHILFAGIFPLSALAYGLFQRAAHEKELRQDLRFLAIEPGNETTGSGDGTETQREQMVELFNVGYSQWNYAMQYALPMLATVLGLSLFFHEPSALFTKSPPLIDGLAVIAIKYGFLGAYVYSIQYIYRRYTTSDLQPSIYMHCGVVLLAGMVFNYIAFNFIDNAEDPGTVEGGLQAIIGFSLGYFPALAIRWFSRLAYGALGVRQRRADFLPLGLIDGISQFHESRLRDEGIDNIQNLASAKIDLLLLNTPFSLQQVIEWIDQAILYVYLEPSEIESFRRGGVRTITDFQAHWYKFHIDNPGGKRDAMADVMDHKEQQTESAPADSAEELTQWKTKRDSRAQQLQSTPERLDALHDNTQDGPNMAHVTYYWSAKRMSAEKILRKQLVSYAEQTQVYEKKLSDLGYEVPYLLGTGSGMGSGTLRRTSSGDGSSGGRPSGYGSPTPGD